MERMAAAWQMQRVEEQAALASVGIKEKKKRWVSKTQLAHG
jgi:hypothetical protein